MTEIQQDELKNSLYPYLPIRSLLIGFFLLIFLGMLLGNGITALIFQLKGIQFDDLLNANPAEINVNMRNLLRGVTFLNHTFTFLLPSFLFVWLLEKRNWANYLNLAITPDFRNVLHGILLIFVALPIVQFLILVNQNIPLPDLLREWEDGAQAAIFGLIQMESPFELFFSLLVMAVLPALGEEFVFRGILQKNLEKSFTNAHKAIWISAIIFSAFHFQFMGFFPRLFLGLILGYLFFWTRNLWVPILAHFFYNGFQVFMVYFAADNIQTMEEGSTEMPILPQIGITLISFIFVAYLARLIKLNNEK